jgi:hypothetical protein
MELVTLVIVATLQKYISACFTRLGRIYSVCEFIFAGLINIIHMTMKRLDSLGHFIKLYLRRYVFLTKTEPH